MKTRTLLPPIRNSNIRRARHGSRIADPSTDGIEGGEVDEIGLGQWVVGGVEVVGTGAGPGRIYL